VTITELHLTPALAEPTLAELEGWVKDWVVNLLERRATQRRRWCPYWFDHPEVVTRMRLLMLSHRQVVERGSALDQSSWFLDHLDRHLDALQCEDGPFASCSPERHSPHRGLRVASIPGGWR
jgi:hypothetical protein